MSNDFTELQTHYADDATLKRLCFLEIENRLLRDLLLNMATNTDDGNSWAKLLLQATEKMRKNLNNEPKQQFD